MKPTNLWAFKIIILTAIISISPAAFAITNDLQNGGFETGLNPWTVQPPGSATLVDRLTAGAPLYFGNWTLFSTTDTGTTISQTVSVVENKTYFLSFQQYSDLPNPPVTVQLDTDGDGTPDTDITPLLRAETLPGIGTWYYIYKAQTTGPLTIFIKYTPSDPELPVYWDNFLFAAPKITFYEDPDYIIPRRAPTVGNTLNLDYEWGSDPNNLNLSARPIYIRIENLHPVGALSSSLPPDPLNPQADIIFHCAETQQIYDTRPPFLGNTDPTAAPIQLPANPWNLTWNWDWATTDPLNDPANGTYDFYIHLDASSNGRPQTPGNWQIGLVQIDSSVNKAEAIPINDPQDYGLDPSTSTTNPLSGFIINNPIQLLRITENLTDFSDGFEISEAPPGNRASRLFPDLEYREVNGYKIKQINPDDTITYIDHCPTFTMGTVSHNTTGTNGIYNDAGNWVRVKLALCNDTRKKIEYPPDSGNYRFINTIPLNWANPKIKVFLRHPPSGYTPPGTPRTDLMKINTPNDLDDGIINDSNLDYPNINATEEHFEPDQFVIKINSPYQVKRYIDDPDVDDDPGNPTADDLLFYADYQIITIWVKVPIYQPPDDYITAHPNEATLLSYYDKISYMIKVFIDSNDNNNPAPPKSPDFTPIDDEEEAYRPFRLMVTVPPDPRIRLTESVVDVGKIWHGNYPGSYPDYIPGWSPLQPFTLQNIGNLNLTNLKLMLRYFDPAKATPVSIDLRSDDTDSTIRLLADPTPANPLDLNDNIQVVPLVWSLGKARPGSPSPTSLTIGGVDIDGDGIVDTGIRLYIPPLLPVGTYWGWLYAYQDDSPNPEIPDHLDLPYDTSHANNDIRDIDEIFSDNYFILKANVVESPLPTFPGAASLNDNINTPAAESMPAAFKDSNNVLWLCWSSNRRADGNIPLPSDPYNLYLANNTANWQANTFFSAADPTFPSSPPDPNYPNLITYYNLYPSLAHLPPATPSKFVLWHLDTWWGNNLSPQAVKRFSYFFYRYYDGNQWSTPIRLPDTPSIKYNPHAILDSYNQLWIFWYGNLGGNWQIFYNIIQNPSGPNPVISTDTLLPTPAELIYCKDPFLMPEWDATPTLINIHIFFTGFSKTSQNEDIYWVKYNIPQLLAYITNPAQTPTRLPFTRLTGSQPNQYDPDDEVLTPHSNRVIYYSRDREWYLDPLNMPIIYVTNISTGPPPVLEITGPYKLDPKTGYLIYPATGSPILKIDPNTGTIVFVDLTIAEQLHNNFSLQVAAEYTPLTRRMTTNLSSDALPIVINELDELPTPPGVVNPNELPNKLWLLWRRTQTPEKAVSLHYQTLTPVYADGNLVDWLPYTTESPIPMDTKISETQFTAFPEWAPTLCDIGLPAGPVTAYKRLCLLWMSAQQAANPTGIPDPVRGNWDIYYQAISPRFIP